MVCCLLDMSLPYFIYIWWSWTDLDLIYNKVKYVILAMIEKLLTSESSALKVERSPSKSDFKEKNECILIRADSEKTSWECKYDWPLVKTNERPRSRALIGLDWRSVKVSHIYSSQLVSSLSARIKIHRYESQYVKLRIFAVEARFWRELNGISAIRR